MPTRFNSIGLAGRLDPVKATQPYQQTIVVDGIDAIDTTDPQSTGVFLPAGRTYLVRAYLNVITAESTAADDSVDVGTTSTGDSILSGVSTGTAGYVGVATLGPLDEGEEITYTLAGADFAELEAELVISIEANEYS